MKAKNSLFLIFLFTTFTLVNSITTLRYGLWVFKNAVTNKDQLECIVNNTIPGGQMESTTFIFRVTDGFGSIYYGNIISLSELAFEGYTVQVDFVPDAFNNRMKTSPEHQLEFLQMALQGYFVYPSKLWIDFYKGFGRTDDPVLNQELAKRFIAAAESNGFNVGIASNLTWYREVFADWFTELDKYPLLWNCPNGDANSKFDAFGGWDFNIGQRYSTYHDDICDTNADYGLVVFIEEKDEEETVSNEMMEIENVAETIGEKPIEAGNGGGFEPEFRVLSFDDDNNFVDSEVRETAEEWLEATDAPVVEIVAPIVEKVTEKHYSTIIVSLESADGLPSKEQLVTMCDWIDSFLDHKVCYGDEI